MQDEIFHEPFHDAGRYHIETSPLICRANQGTGFYVITDSVMKKLQHEYIQRMKRLVASGMWIRKWKWRKGEGNDISARVNIKILHPTLHKK